MHTPFYHVWSNALQPTTTACVSSLCVLCCDVHAAQLDQKHLGKEHGAGWGGDRCQAQL